MHRLNRDLFASIVITTTVSLSVIALAVLWIARSSVLDYWLMLVVLAFLSEGVILGFFIRSRFDLGFYVDRAYSLAASVFVLAMLVTQTTKLYARLARTKHDVGALARLPKSQG